MGPGVVFYKYDKHTPAAPTSFPESISVQYIIDI